VIRKSEGIVLKTRKFRETSLIATILLRTAGRRDFIVKGIRTSKPSGKLAIFQPMSIVDVVYYDKPNRDLLLLTEAHPAVILKTAQSHPGKLALAIPALELYDISVKEEEINIPLYEFLRNFLLTLDSSDDKWIHHFLHFAVHLTTLLGFQPHDDAGREGKPVYFDLNSGTIYDSAKGNDSHRLILDLLRCDSAECRNLIFTNEAKKAAILHLLDYYRLHVEAFRAPGSIAVFGEVFA